MFRKIQIILISASLVTLLAACSGSVANPITHKTTPVRKITLYSDALRNLGSMLVIYQNKKLRVMRKHILDKTGSAIKTTEIPRDISIMVDSALNSIGGTLIVIPYISDEENLNYDNQKPDNEGAAKVVITGGITEFDKALLYKGGSVNAGADIGGYGLDMSHANKTSLSRATLDFNMIDNQKNETLQRIQAINSISLNKTVEEDEVAVNIKGLAFGAKGTTKKVQGRHAAVRLLVEVSMIQLIGRYQNIPYWRLIQGAEKDREVMKATRLKFKHMKSESERVIAFQQFLYLHKYLTTLNGQKDAAFDKALQAFASKEKISNVGINLQTYLALFESVPIDEDTEVRREEMDELSPVDIAADPIMAPLKKLETVGQGDLKISTNKQNFEVGEKLTISLSVKKPMFVRLMVVSSNGNISTLLPNIDQLDNMLLPNKIYQIPASQSQGLLTVGLPKGIDRIIAIGSSKQIPFNLSLVNSEGGINPKLQNKAFATAISNITIK